MLELGSKIQSQVQSEVGKNQREYFLREQLKAIQKELGEGDEQTKDVEELKERLDAASLPEAVMKEAMRELDRLSKMPAAAAEYTVSRTYLDWIAMLPWQKRSEETIDLVRAKQVLDDEHSGLEKAKDRILEFLAVRKLNPALKSPILCFAGPPGVGKTSLARSIAQSLGRTFVRVSLGGMRDEAEIRGHRRTYIGALPGQIIQGLRRAETRNPVFILDEVDNSETTSAAIPRRRSSKSWIPSRTRRSGITISTCRSICRKCSSSRRPTSSIRFRRRSATAWKCWRFPATPRKRSWPSAATTWPPSRSRTTV